MRFKQAVGRLLRTLEDQGRVTVLDRRIVSRPWGRLLLRGLPDFELVIERTARTPRSAERRPLKEAAARGA